MQARRPARLGPFARGDPSEAGPLSCSVDRSVEAAMRFELLDFHSEPAETATIRRISALGIHWRVGVETFRGASGWAGRLVFEPQSPLSRHDTRRGPITL